MPALIISALALLFILWLLGEPYLTERKRQRIRAQSFPAAWREILKRRVPMWRALKPRCLNAKAQLFFSRIRPEMSAVSVGMSQGVIWFFTNQCLAKTLYVRWRTELVVSKT